MMSDPELDKDMARRRRCFPSVPLPTPLIEKIEQVHAPSKSSFAREVAIERLQKRREELAQNKRVACDELSALFTLLRKPRLGN